MALKRASAFRTGTDAIARRARIDVVALTIAKHAPIFVILCLPPALWAVADKAWSLAIVLIFPALLGGIAFVATWRQKLPDDLRHIEALVTVALVFFLGAILTTPAFITLGMPWPSALFEATSAVTTTGHSVARDAESWPFAGHFLRGWLQWCGGLVMATAVLALLLPAGVPTHKLGQAGIDQGDRIASTRQQARQLLGVYLGLTVIMAALTALVIPDWREAVAVILAAISTAGFSPRADSLASYSALAQGVVMFTCILGSISLLTFVLLLQGKLHDAWALGSARRFLITLGLLCTVYILLLVVSGETSPMAIYREVLNLISGLTTTGFSVGPMPTAGAALLILILAMVMGGDFGSTAGGIKLARIGLLARAALHAVQVSRVPKRAVAPLRAGGDPVDEGTLVSIIALLTLYFTTLFLLWFHCLWHGLPALPALFDVVSTLSTVGLSTGVVDADLPTDLKLSLSFGMWLGRLEFIAVLVLLAPRSWLERA